VTGFPPNPRFTDNTRTTFVQGTFGEVDVILAHPDEIRKQHRVYLIDRERGEPMIGLNGDQILEACRILMEAHRQITMSVVS
jgi:hypothetical protein